MTNPNDLNHVNTINCCLYNAGEMKLLSAYARILCLATGSVWLLLSDLYSARFWVGGLPSLAKIKPNEIIRTFIKGPNGILKR